MLFTAKDSNAHQNTPKQHILSVSFAGLVRPVIAKHRKAMQEAATQSKTEHTTETQTKPHQRKATRSCVSLVSRVAAKQGKANQSHAMYSLVISVSVIAAKQRKAMQITPSEIKPLQRHVEQCNAVQLN